MLWPRLMMVAKWWEWTRRQEEVMKVVRWAQWVMNICGQGAARRGLFMRP